MRLRQKLLLSFLLFGVLPLIAMGVRSWTQSSRAVEGLIGRETAQIAERTARELRERLDLQESDYALLSRSDPILRLLRARVSRDSGSLDGLEREMRGYATELWSTIQASYVYAEVKDVRGEKVVSLGDQSAATPARGGEPVFAVGREVPDPESGKRIGTLLVVARLRDLTRGPVFERRFGDQGWTTVIGGNDRQVLRAIPDSAPAGELPLTRMTGPSGTLSFGPNSARFVASWTHLEGNAWTTVAVGSVNEFAGPFVRQRVLDVALLAGVVSLVALAFAWLVDRATRPLDALTQAADRIGAGDLSPELPPPGPDETGRLTVAFSTMTGRIREMIAQVEAGRQTAVLGRFAAELSHEIRNPLTAIKISLQGLERDARNGQIPESSRDSVRMALTEIRRLDDAVRTALRAGRPPAPPRLFDIRDTLRDAVELLRPQAVAQNVHIESPSVVEPAELSGDEEGLRGALVNLLLNAIESMPGGGLIRVKSTHLDPGTFEIRIADQGPGIPVEVRDRVFTPFYTTKDGGTGLGLSLALQTLRAHGGALVLGDPARGTEVIVTLPLKPALVPA